MYILGIDPGFGRVGYSVIEYKNNKYRPLEYGCITTEANTELASRLKKIYEELDEVICKYKIDEAAIESLYFNTNIKTGIQVAEARGVILLAIKNHDIKINEYTPLQVKQALVGYGRADKIQIKKAVKDILKLEKMPKLDDTTDAIAIAICDANSNKYNEYIK